MSGIKTVFRLIGVVWLVAILAIGIGGTYLDRHPDAAVAYAFGTMSVDPEAGPLEKAKQLGEGAAAARELIDAGRRFDKDARRTGKDRAPKSVAEQWSQDRVEDEADQARRDRYYGY